MPVNTDRGLPDASRLLSFNRKGWRALGLRLKDLGITSDYVQQIKQVGWSFPHIMREPLLRWHSRRLTGPAGDVLRLLRFGDGVSDEAARRALGESLLSGLIEVGLILRDDSGLLFSPFSLKLVMNQLYLICDDSAYRGNAVMGVSETTGVLCKAAMLTRPVERVLDLGCGAGTVGLLLSGNSTQVVGTDINPRAIILSRVNAAINGLDNVEFLEGDRFAPVAGETFDLIVSQPPFVAQAEGFSPAGYLYGGPRGDEIALQMLSELEPYLTATGRAVFILQWPESDKPLEQHVRAAVGSEQLNILLFQSPPSDANDLCLHYAAAEHFELGEDFESMVISRREHLDRLGISGARTTLSIIERAAHPPGWTVALDLSAASAKHLSGRQIDKLVATQRLLRERVDTLRKAVLRVPSGTVLTSERPFNKSGDSKLALRPPPRTLTPSVEINEQFCALLSIVNETENVDAAIDQFAAAHQISFQDALEQIIPALKEAMRLGVLEAGPVL